MNDWSTRVANASMVSFLVGCFLNYKSSLAMNDHVIHALQLAIQVNKYNR